MVINSISSSTNNDSISPAASMPWLDSGATHAFYRASDSPSPPSSSSRGLSVLLPNNDTITSTHQSTASLGSFKYPVNVFSDDDLHHSLESVATFTNDMRGSVLFTEQGATIYDSSNRQVNFSPKHPTDRIWTLDRARDQRPTSPPHIHIVPTINAVVRHDLHADFVQYAHACFFSPPNSTFVHALDMGWLRSYPHLTTSMFRQNLPNSVATAKGHLDLNRQGQRSTRNCSDDESPDTDDADNGETFDPSAILCLTVSLRDDTINYSDLPGRFPVESFLGNNYVLLSFFRGHVHTEALPDRSGPSLVAAYRSTFEYYHRHFQRPKFQRLDNETSVALENFLRHEAHVTIQYVPPNNKRTNKAERIIRSWKNHYISGLHTCDPRLPLQLWDEFLPQTDITYNILHPWTLNPKLSAYEGFHGHQYDFNAHPIAPVGTHVVVYETPSIRQSWAAHGLDGFYLGPAIDHYRSYNVFVVDTRSNRVSDTLAWFPAAVRMPGSSPLDLIHAALHDLIAALKIHRSSPTVSDARTPTALDASLTAALRDASNLFADIRLPPQSDIPSASPAPLQRVPIENFPPPVPLQRVATAPPPPTPLERVPTTPFLVQPALNRPRRHHSATSPTPSRVFSPTTRSAVKKQSTHFFQHVGRSFRDKESNERFKIVGVDLPRGSRGRGSMTPHFRFYDIDKHKYQPTDDAAFERTRCSEVLDKHSPYVEFITPLALDAEDTPTLGATYMAAVLSLPPDPAVPTRWQNGRKIPLHPLSSKARANASIARLNLNPDGSPLNYRGTFRGPNSSEWRRMDGEEICRLIDTATIKAIHRNQCPLDRLGDITYYNPKPKEKYNSETDEITRRIRGTIGGDRLHYPGIVSAATADLFTVKALLQSVVSDRYKNKTDTRFATLDIVDFFLGTPLDRPEFVTIPLRFIPVNVLAKYNLHEFISRDAILFQVDKCMYGLPQAAYLSNRHLVRHLQDNGYIQDPNVPCLFSHATSDLQFCLVVDDFGIKYTYDDDLDHLISTLQNGGWKVKTDRSGSKYLGLSLKWNYINNEITHSMPTCVSKGLTRFAPDGPLKGAPTPAVYIPPRMGSHLQHETIDDSELVSPDAKEWVQAVNGYFLYYARAQDPRILPACTDISATQANPTAQTVSACWRFLNFLTVNPVYEVTLRGCDMILKIYSDASFQSRPNSVSVAGGWHYCGNKDDDSINGTLHALSVRIPTVCGSVAEAEYAACYINGVQAAWERTVLTALGHPQPPTRIITDNECAVGICNDTITIRKSKAIAMRYHWIRDRVRLGEFTVDWVAGKNNIADFFTKALPVYMFPSFASILSGTEVPLVMNSLYAFFSPHMLDERVC